MKTLAELGRALDAARRNKGLSNKELAHRIGLTPLSVGHVLSGKSAVRATNLMAMADELDLELVLMPKAVAQALVQPPEGRIGESARDHRDAAPYVSDYDRALQQLKDRSSQHAGSRKRPRGEGR